MDEYGVFGGRVPLEQGGAVAAAGFCRRANAPACQQGLERLRGLRFLSKDPAEIDRILAEKLAEAYRDQAEIVGATVYIEGVSHEVFRTGGVLGRPAAGPEDAGSELEELGGGAWMYTAPGGPGWVGHFSRETAELLARFTLSCRGTYPAKAIEVYRRLTRLSPRACLFVSDGTGYDSLGLCAVRLGEMERNFFV